MGTAILLVEQNVSRALSLVQRAYVLESGKVIMHGTSAELADNKQVQAAYLGISRLRHHRESSRPSERSEREPGSITPGFD
jgi:energy-coupling factor transporter ATP-binding protein EcfA2